MLLDAGTFTHQAATFILQASLGRAKDSLSQQLSGGYCGPIYLRLGKNQLRSLMNASEIHIHLHYIMLLYSDLLRHWNTCRVKESDSTEGGEGMAAHYKQRQ